MSFASERYERRFANRLGPRFADHFGPRFADSYERRVADSLGPRDVGPSRAALFAGRSRADLARHRSSARVGGQVRTIVLRPGSPAYAALRAAAVLPAEPGSGPPSPYGSPRSTTQAWGAVRGPSVSPTQASSRSSPSSGPPGPLPVQAWAQPPVPTCEPPFVPGTVGLCECPPPTVLRNGRCEYAPARDHPACYPAGVDAGSYSGQAQCELCPFGVMPRDPLRATTGSRCCSAKEKNSQPACQETLRLRQEERTRRRAATSRPTGGRATYSRNGGVVVRAQSTGLWRMEVRAADPAVRFYQTPATRPT